MPHPFPHTYTVDLSRTDSTFARLSSGKANEVIAAAPSEFGGPEGHWSPETLLMASIELCFFTTLESLATKEKMEIHSLNAKISGQLDKTKMGLVFTKIELQVDLKVSAGDQEKAKQLIERAEKYCIISNSLKTPVEVVANII